MIHTICGTGLTSLRLGSRRALATPTAQQKCDNARITAWKAYTSCIDSAVAKDAKDEFKAFWKCRHAYVKKFNAFQVKPSLSGSTCQTLPRYTDNGDQTVTDNFNGLVWEKKDNASGVHDKDNLYTWSTGTDKGDGTAFATFLTGAGTGLNVAGFARAKEWRLPTLAELQTIMFDFSCTGAGSGVTCTCAPGPCVDGALDTANTPSGPYWSAYELCSRSGLRVVRVLLQWGRHHRRQDVERPRPSRTRRLVIDHLVIRQFVNLVSAAA